MGMFDTVNVFMQCPYCGMHKDFDAQTKDLSNSMWTFTALDEDWERHPFGKKFRKGLPFFPGFPEDRNLLWRNQAEYAEARAKIPKERKSLKYINVTAGCDSAQCQFDADRRDILQQGCPSGFGRQFEGKIKIKKGLLMGPIYDLKLDKLTEKKLRTYKNKDEKQYQRLKKKYEHEPIMLRHWN